MQTPSAPTHDAVKAALTAAGIAPTLPGLARAAGIDEPATWADALTLDTVSAWLAANAPQPPAEEEAPRIGPDADGAPRDSYTAPTGIDPARIGLLSEEDAIARAGAHINDMRARFAPDDAPAGRRSAAWLGAGFPVCPREQRRGRTVPVGGPLPSAARRAIADVVMAAEPVAVPVYLTPGAPVADPTSYTLERPDREPGEPAAEPAGYLPSSSVGEAGAVAVKAAIGVNVKGKAATVAVRTVVRWMERHLSDADTSDADGDARVAGAPARRSAALSALSTLTDNPDDKGAKARLREAMRDGADAERLARLARRHGTASDVWAEGTARGTATALAVAPRGKAPTVAL